MDQSSRASITDAELEIVRDLAAQGRPIPAIVMAAIVERVEASDVIVYLALNPVMKPHLSGTLTWMTRAGGYRYVRASINPDQNNDQMIATVAHELQHALEVVADPTVVNEGTLVTMYRRIGQQHNSAAPTRWETTAAQEAGFQVRRELSAVTSTATVARASRDQNEP